jgi:hypothetical protein
VQRAQVRAHEVELDDDGVVGVVNGVDAVALIGERCS